KSMALNPYEPNNFLRTGMCLDWLGQHDAAYAAYQKALLLDPNSYYIHAILGWHYVQMEDWGKARDFFAKSIGLSAPKNPIAQSYLKILDGRSPDPPPVRSNSPPKQ